MKKIHFILLMLCVAVAAGYLGYINGMVWQAEHSPVLPAAEEPPAAPLIEVSVTEVKEAASGLQEKPQTEIQIEVQPEIQGKPEIQSGISFEAAPELETELKTGKDEQDKKIEERKETGEKDAKNEKNEKSEESEKIVKQEREKNGIRGVSKAAINRLRGTRGHALAANAWNAGTVLRDYAKVGITLSRSEATEIYTALKNYTSPGSRSRMRAAAAEQAAGKKTDAEAKRWLEQYQRVLEYTHIAPSYPRTENLFRGISGDAELAKRLASLRAGDIFDLGRPSGFVTLEKTARSYAGKDGVVLSVTGGVRDGISLSGFSADFAEKEVLVSETSFTVESVNGDVSTGGRTILLKEASK